MGGVSAIPELITGPPPPDTNMKAANKEAAEECLSKAQAAFGKRSFKEALRLAEKSSRMCRTEEADEFIEEVNAALQSDGGDPSEDPGSEAAAGPEVRQREGAADRDSEQSGSSRSPPAYTRKQKEAVDRVLKAEDFYSILGVTRDVSEDDLKKAYRKLALQLHPDKNTAPRAEDAFKNVGKAYDTLSNAEKRRVYDQYGEQGLQGMPSHGQNQREFYGEFDAERIFREFFGFNFDLGQAFYFDDGEVLYHARNRGHNRRVFFHRTTPCRFATDPQQENIARSTLSCLLFLIPLLLLVVLPLLSSMLIDEPFKLHKTHTFTNERKVEKMGREWLYYVKADFEWNYRTRRDIAAVERNVLLKYADFYLQRCQSERIQKSFAIHRASNAKDLSAAHSLPTPDCDLYAQVVKALA